MAIILGRKGGGSGTGGGSVQEITSTDNSVTITDSSGPTVDLSVSGGSQPSETVVLSASDLAAMDATPPELVAAPGAGFAIIPDRWVIVTRPGSELFPNNEFEPQIAGADVTESGFAGTSPAVDETPYVTIARAVTAGHTLADWDNEPVVLTNSGVTPMSSGSIAASNLGDGGADYAPGDTGLIGNNGTGYVVDTVDGGGAVLTYHLGGDPDFYAVEDGVETEPDGAQPGVGAGFTVDITAVTPGDGEIEITTYYDRFPAS